MPKSKVAVIIVNWKQKAATLACLRSCANLDYDNFTVILVDNNSGDDTLETVAKLYPDVAIISNEKNLGYTGANNRGVELALSRSADYCFILNNDTIVRPNVLKLMVRYMESNPYVGVLGPLVLFMHNPDVIQAFGAYFEQDKWRFGHNYYGQNECDLNTETELEVDYVPGCAMLIRSRVLDSVGRLDDDFFLLCEDVDFCLRVRKAGFKVKVIAAPRILHAESQSFGGTYTPTYCYYLFRNWFLLAKKHFHGTQRRKIYSLIFYRIYQFYRWRQPIISLLKINQVIYTFKAIINFFLWHSRK